MCRGTQRAQQRMRHARAAAASRTAPPGSAAPLRAHARRITSSACARAIKCVYAHAERACLVNGPSRNGIDRRRANTKKARASGGSESARHGAVEERRACSRRACMVRMEAMPQTSPINCLNNEGSRCAALWFNACLKGGARQFVKGPQQACIQSADHCSKEKRGETSTISACKTAWKA